jgi:hypothetical protein
MHKNRDPNPNLPNPNPNKIPILIFLTLTPTRSLPPFLLNSTNLQHKKDNICKRNIKKTKEKRVRVKG